MILKQVYGINENLETARDKHGKLDARYEVMDDK